jgi:Flp pilus assembly protein TadD
MWVTLAGTVLLLASAVGCESPLRRSFATYERTGDWKGAVAVLKQRVKVAPRDAEAQFLLGRALLEQGDFAAARKAFIASNAASSKYERRIDYFLEKYWRLEMQRGNEAMESGQTVKAVQHYDNAVALKPEKNDGLRALGDASLLVGELRKAVEAYKTVVARDKKDWRTRNNLSEAYFRLGDYERSVAMAQEALQLQPDRAEALQRLGYAYHRLGKINEAFSSFDRAIKARFNAKVARDYARLALGQRQYRRAAAVLQTILQRSPADTSALQALADAYLGMNDLRSAAETYEKLLAINPAAKNARSALFMVYMLSGEDEKANELRSQSSDGIEEPKKSSGREQR